MMYHAKDIRKKQLIGRKMSWIIKYLGRLALRPTASSSPENSHFSQKLLLSCAEAGDRIACFSYCMQASEFAIFSDLFTWKNSQLACLC